MSSMLELPPALAEPPAAPVPVREPHLRLVPTAPLDFDQAVRRITPRLQRYAARRLGDVHEAEELVQEALLRAYKHGALLATEDDLIAWCTVVTGRLVIDRLRVRGRSTNVAEVPEGTRVGRDTAEVVVARDEARMALDALDAMPARQAAVLWAREIEGQGYDEIGQRFGMTEPAVRSILTRARKALRKEYAARGGTLPVAGLAVLAPWITGLRWADRVRAAATKLAAPAAIGTMALGLVGGALHLPYADGTSSPPVTTQAVVSRGLDSAALPAGASATRPTLTAGHASATAGPADLRRPTLTQDGPVQVPCAAGSRQSGAVAGAGNEDCAGSDGATNIYLTSRLPNNPTGVRDVGVETDKVRCDQLPTIPLTTCTNSPAGGSR